jgi:ABC-type Zn2+ transport system substrate-binding protein/surface adhesin
VAAVEVSGTKETRRRFGRGTTDDDDDGEEEDAD